MINAIPKTVHRSCPVCSSSERENIITLSYAMPENCPLPQDTTIAVCKRCSMVFNSSCASEKSFHEYYWQANHYATSLSTGTGGLNNNDIMRYQLILKLIKQYCQLDARIIDVGCGKGGLPEYLQNQGYKNSLGVDPTGNTNTHHPVIQGDAYSLYESNINADFIIFSHVLEHLSTPAAAMTSALKCLAEDGYLFLEVPDADSYGQGRFDPLTEFYFEHVNHFNSHSLRNFSGKFQLLELTSGIRTIIGAGGEIRCLYALYQKSNINPLKNLTPEKALANKVIRYTANWEKSLTENFGRLVNSNKPIVLWGVSQYMQLVLEMALLGRYQIYAYIDRDEYKQTWKLHGQKVCGLEKLQKLPEDTQILIDARYLAPMQRYMDSQKLTQQLIPIGFC